MWIIPERLESELLTIKALHKSAYLSALPLEMTLMMMMMMMMMMIMPVRSSLPEEFIRCLGVCATAATRLLPTVIVCPQAASMLSTVFRCSQETSVHDLVVPRNSNQNRLTGHRLHAWLNRLLPSDSLRVQHDNPPKSKLQRKLSGWLLA